MVTCEGEKGRSGEALGLPKSEPCTDTRMLQMVVWERDLVCRGHNFLCRPGRAILRGILLARVLHLELCRETSEACRDLRLLTLLCVYVGVSDTVRGELKLTRNHCKALGSQERLRESVLFSLVKRRFWGERKHIIPIVQYLQGGHQQDGARLLTAVHGGRMGDKSIN